jgi:DUF1009 family protein
MTVADDSQATMRDRDGGPLGIVCGGGSLPFAVAEAARTRGRRVVLLALRNAADGRAVAAYPHHWIRLGEVGRCLRLLRAEGCRDVVFIGSVLRPTPFQLWPDFGALRNLPLLLRSFRGGDAHLLAGIAHVFERAGFRLLAAHDVAPAILLPQGALGRIRPGARDDADIARGLALLRAIGPFDVGQAVVVADNRVLAIEAAEGTDQMLAKLAEWRRLGRLHASSGAGVLVKAPKPGQDQRIDLPSIGPQTVAGAAAAGLSGIAAVAGATLVAEPEQTAAAAADAGLFVVGVTADGRMP